MSRGGRAKWTPNRLSDLVGMRVRLTKNTGNTLCRIPKDTVMTVQKSGTIAWHKIALEGDPCACCGVAVRISHMRIDDLELAT